MDVLEWARKVQAIAQSGLAFTTDPFDRERYEQLQALVASVLAGVSGRAEDEMEQMWLHEKGYATPKVDVRGGVFVDERVLLVRERSDGLWTLPGGWADVNESPSVAVEREIFEESGFRTRTVKLAALYDRNCHPHPPMLFHVYKLFFICEFLGGQAQTSLETDAVGFFHVDELPALSTPRVTAGQIGRLFDHHRERGLPTDFD